MSERIDYDDLVARAIPLVTEKQRADYEFLLEHFPNIGRKTIKNLLLRLSRRGIVRQGIRRRWTVIVNTDGTPKPEGEIPPKRKFKRIHRRQPRRVVPGAPILEAPIDERTKLRLLGFLVRSAKGTSALTLRRIVDDVKLATKVRRYSDKYQ